MTNQTTDRVAVQATDSQEWGKIGRIVCRERTEFCDANSNFDTKTPVGFFGSMLLDEKKKEALLFWFNTYGTSIKLDNVDSLRDLWQHHIPSLLNCLKTDRNIRVTSSSALNIYQEVISYLFASTGQEKFVESLTAEKAAEGNELEIGKFLAVLLNEIRISKDNAITDSVAVMQKYGYDLPLSDILSVFDEERDDWWSIMVSHSHSTSPDGRNLQFVTPRRSTYSVEEFTGMSVNRASFITPRCPPRRPDSNAYTVGRCDGSPLMEALNSPKVRELRREREIKTLRKQLNDFEDQLMVADKKNAELNQQIESLVNELCEKKARIRELESVNRISQQTRDDLEEKVLFLSKQLEVYQRQNESQKERLASYKESNEKLEDSKVELTEQLKAKEDTLTAVKRELRDVKDELYKEIQTKRSLESERNNIGRVLEELKRNSELDREQYHAAISDCRRRYEEENSKNMALYSEEMEKNAALQSEIREKSEQIEELQRKFNAEKCLLEQNIEDLKRSCRQKCENVTKRLNETQTELEISQERNRSLTKEHEEALQHLESVHSAETNKQDVQLSAARARINELEEVVTKKERAILDHRKELACLATQKDAIEVDLAKALAEMRRKDEELDETKRTIEKSLIEVESLSTKHAEAVRSLECLKTQEAKLQTNVEEKETKIAELEKTVEELGMLKEAYDKASEDLTRIHQLHDIERKRFEKIEMDMRDAFEEEKLKKEELTTQVLELKEDLENEESAKTELEEEIYECRAEIESKTSKINELSENLDNAQSQNREQFEALEFLKEELKVTLEEGTATKADCEKLREKDRVRTVQLHNLMEKFQFVEDHVVLSNERSSKLEAENLTLKEMIDMYELAFMRSTREPMKESSTSSLERSEAALLKNAEISPQVLPLFTTSLDEPSVMETRSLIGPSYAIEVPAPSPWDDRNFLVKKVVEKCDAATSVSDLALISSLQAVSQSNLTNALTGSDLSLATTRAASQSRQSLARSDFSRPSTSDLSIDLRKRDDISVSTDRSRLSELQKRNAMLHPAMRCAYATELTSYGSPSGNENTIKHGTTRKKGKKLMERAASYVKKKLPMSESTNSIQ
ncbi:hypothetical protein RB195_009282 [Necator americanus]|uniref:HOOK N-terminal domain-containing protein n=1 Tax=Necator americanus TaxID=51031 RepID=A0ABR1CU26_NECAM